MDKNEALGESAFEKLVARNVPHIIEKIFSSLDDKTFNECQQVCKTWNHILILRSFQNPHFTKIFRKNFGVPLKRTILMKY